MVAAPPIEELQPTAVPDVDTVPGPKSRDLLAQQRERDSSAVLYPMEIPIAFDSGQGATLRDVDGNTYLDFFAGIGVLNVGHANPYVTEAIHDQTAALTHALDFPTEPRMELLEALNRIAPGDLAGDNRVVFGGPTGSDAIEASIKLATHVTGNDGMIAFYGSFHGETAGAYTLTAETSQSTPQAGLLAGVEHVQYPDPDWLDLDDDAAVETALSEVETLLSDHYGAMANPAGIWVEAMQGEGGTVVPPEGFLTGLRDLADEHDVLLIVDEIQTGMGRTGEWWGCEHYDVTPDVMPMGKALGGGLPLSGTMYCEELDTWEPGSHTGTFRGHVPAMRAAIRTIEYIEERDLLAHSRDLGRFMKRRLRAETATNSHVRAVRGRGLFLGIELVTDDGQPAPDLLDTVRTDCYENGVLVWAGGRADHVIRLLPPLVLTRDQAEVGLDVLLAAIERAT